MTLVLALETATSDTEVAVADERGPLAEVAVRRGRRHAENLHPAIERACADAGAGVGDLTAIGVDVGPGLFTGLRVGVTAAKTLALVLGVPLVAVTSLEVLEAAAAPFAGEDTLVVPVVDVRRGEVAWRIGGMIVLSAPKELGRSLAPLLEGEPAAGAAGAGARGSADGAAGPPREVLLVGDGAVAHGPEIVAGAARVAARIRLAGAALATPPARVLAALTVERAAAGAVTDPLTCVPLYLREADAAINWESRPLAEAR